MRIAPRLQVERRPPRRSRRDPLVRHRRPHVTHEGTLFALRTWDIRYPQGQERITDAFHNEVVASDNHATSVTS